MKGKTTIIISHDLNLIRNADKILVIKAGEIEEMGTHEELLGTGGLYASLYTKQYGPTEVSKATGLSAEVLIPQSGNGKRQAELEIAMKNLLEKMDYDLPHSEHFLQKLPALAEAFDADKMKGILQGILFDRSNSAYTITECEPGKAIYLANHQCNMQFDLKTQENATGEVFNALVNAHLFPELADCKMFLKKNLIPIMRQMNGRPEVKPFSRPAAVIEPLKMVISVFPMDGMLPTLIAATDTRRMVEIFNDTLPEALSGEYSINKVQLDLAHYGRYQRCVLRYKLDGELADTYEQQQKIVYGKVDADGQGGLTVQVISALREKLREPNLPYYFRVPMSYGYLPDLDLLLMEALPGDPVIKRLIKEGKDDSGTWQESNFTVEESMAVCARMLLTLHSSGIKLGRRNSLETKSGSVKEEIRTVQQVYPELGDQLCNWMDEILEYAQEFPPMPLCLSHGDYTYTQLIFDGKQGGLVDFDTICQAEPALDLGQFLAYQRLTILKDHPSLHDAVDRLSEIFLDTYIAEARGWVHDEQLLRARVSVYELISLIRLMLHSWQKFKGSRLKLALSIFEERYKWLKQVS